METPTASASMLVATASTTRRRLVSSTGLLPVSQESSRAPQTMRPPIRASRAKATQ